MLTMFLCGVGTGTLLDGIHSAVGLQVYDMFPVAVGGLNTSWVVPPLLGLFYVVLGALHPITDNLVEGEATQAARARSEDPAWLALGYGVLALNIKISATLYAADVPYWQIFLVLAALSAVNWRVFDGTVQGLALAAFCSVAAPASELVLLQLLPLWHYSRPDLLGSFVSWVPWCYFFYTPALGNLARYRWRR